MPKLTREDLEARYRLFDHFALNDQRNYYSRAIKEYDDSSDQTTRLGATFALLTGASALIVGLLAQIIFEGGECVGMMGGRAFWQSCDVWITVYNIMKVLSVVFPVMAALINTFADLYQWERHLTIYDSALQNIAYADALSPDATIDDDALYEQVLQAYVESALSVMEDETAQWGQSVRRPKATDDFLNQSRARVSGLTGSKPDSGG